MAMNLRLPICPKCNDTKYVEKLSTRLTIVGAPEYGCLKCKICWGATRVGRKPVYGTIEEWKEYIYENNTDCKGNS